jgi:hypothetical protein
MVEAMGIKIMGGHLQWHDLPAVRHKSLPIGSEVSSGGHRLTGRLVIWCASLSICQEKRTKNKNKKS